MQQEPDATLATTGQPETPREASFWKRIAGGMKQAALATGRGLQYVYQKGDENKHYVVPAINGLVGDKLAEANDARAIAMSFRVGGRDVSAVDVAASIPEASTVVVFIHGLMSDEVLWQSSFAAEEGYGTLLDREAGLVSLYVRYNSGRHISQNGRDLASLLQDLDAACGERMQRLVLVAHSMGGLVCRSGGFYGQEAGFSWLAKLEQVILIGVPNDGSFLEKFGHLATVILRTIWNYPTRLVGRIADERSAGIKDLRWGFMVDEDWQRDGSNDLLNVRRTNIPPLPQVRYHVLLGSLVEDLESPIAMYFGDGLVGTRSAAGRQFAATAEPEHPFVQCRAFPETGHVGLLASRPVYDYIKAAVLGE